jgi:dihydropteroate synthase
MHKRKIFHLRLLTRSLVLGKRSLLMGVLNITPDSFSDGGQFLTPERAIRQALSLQQSGADVLDIGAESTRPGSVGISVVEELRRLLPVLQALRGKLKIPISIDTRKASVAEIAIGAGAEIVNDVSGLNHDARIAEVAARRRVPLILMHMRGEPRTMQEMPFARNVMKDVSQGLQASVKKARKAGVAKSQIIIDPGIGFGKSFQQNYELLQRLPELAKLGYPLLVGTSRKGFLGRTLALAKRGAPRQIKSVPAEERIWATAATVTASILGGAHIVRVHDVAEMAQVARVADCLLNPDCYPQAHSNAKK